MKTYDGLCSNVAVVSLLDFAQRYDSTTPKRYQANRYNHFFIRCNGLVVQIQYFLLVEAFGTCFSFLSLAACSAPCYVCMLGVSSSVHDINTNVNNYVNTCNCYDLGFRYEHQHALSFAARGVGRAVARCLSSPAPGRRALHTRTRDRAFAFVEKRCQRCSPAAFRYFLLFSGTPLHKQ